jgi:hypothetical protein
VRVLLQLLLLVMLPLPLLTPYELHRRCRAH